MLYKKQIGTSNEEYVSITGECNTIISENIYFLRQMWRKSYVYIRCFGVIS